MCVCVFCVVHDKAGKENVVCICIMRASQVLFQTFKSPRTRAFKSGIIGFSIGCIGSALLTLGLIDIEERQQKWNEDILHMSRSIRTLEEHVKSLEENKKT